MLLASLKTNLFLLICVTILHTTKHCLFIILSYLIVIDASSFNVFKFQFKYSKRIKLWINLNPYLFKYQLNNSTMSSNTYSLSFCVKCQQKTGWLKEAILKLGKNKVPGLYGKCCICKSNKYTFVAKCFYEREIKKYVTYFALKIY